MSDFLQIHNQIPYTEQPFGSDFSAGLPTVSLGSDAASEVSPPGAADRSEEASSVKNTSFSGCETCRNRKYVDVSAESDVSFQAPAHINPASSATVVAGHERQHVANAVQKGSAPNAKLVSATVRLITSVCPECGRRYVSGGVTNTVIQYSTNPYSQSKKSLDSGLLTGSKVDIRL